MAQVDLNEHILLRSLKILNIRLSSKDKREVSEVTRIKLNFKEVEKLTNIYLNSKSKDELSKLDNKLLETLSSVKQKLPIENDISFTNGISSENEEKTEAENMGLTNVPSKPDDREKEMHIKNNDVFKEETKLHTVKLSEEELSAKWLAELRERKAKRPNNVNQNFETDLNTETELMTQRKIQDQLTSGLLSLSSTLKGNTLAMSDLLKGDDEILNEAERNLSGSLDTLKLEGAKLKQLNKSGFSFTLLYYLAILLVVLLYVMSVVFVARNKKL